MELGLALILHLAYLLLAVLYVGGSVAVWMAFIDDRPVEIVHSVEAIKPTFTRDELIVLRWQTEKVRNCPGIVTRTLTDEGATTYILPLPPTLIAKHGTNDINLAFEFPSSLKAGRYFFQSKIEWLCNGLTVIEQVNPRVPIEVVEGDQQ